MTETRIVDIPGFDGKYRASDDGIIYRRTAAGDYKELKPWDNGHGYKQVRLCKDGEQWTCYVHHLVLEAFGVEPDEVNPDGTPFEGEPEIHHIDCDRSNNSLENLVWCDRKYNNNHKKTHTENIVRAAAKKIKKKLDEFADKHIYN